MRGRRWHAYRMRTAPVALAALAAIAPAAHAGLPPENPRDFAQQVYSRFVADAAVPTGWQGTPGSCDPAPESLASNDATQGTLNAMRALARMPPVEFAGPENFIAAEAATLMAANQAVSHFPPPDWRCWTRDGAKAAEVSNLAIGVTGPRAVAALIDDFGDNNAAVGHRMNLLDPAPRVMGAASTDISMAITAARNPARFAPQRMQAAWPPPGWFPSQWMTQRWSVAFYGSSDTAGARVSMTLDGAPISVSGPSAAESVDRFDNALVWEPDPAALGRAADGGEHEIRVTISGVRVVGVRTTLRYVVRTFRAAEVPGGYVPPDGLSGLAVSRRGGVVIVRGRTARAGTVMADVSHNGFPIPEVRRKMRPGPFTIRVPLRGITSRAAANIQAAVVLTSPDGMWDTLLSRPRRF